MDVHPCLYVLLFSHTHIYVGSQVSCFTLTEPWCLSCDERALFRLSRAVSKKLQHLQTGAIIDLMTNVLTEEKLMISSDRG